VSNFLILFLILGITGIIFLIFLYSKKNFQDTHKIKVSKAPLKIKGSQQNDQLFHSQDLLLAAIQKNDLTSVLKLLGSSTCSPLTDTVDAKGRTPLILAVQKMNLNMVQALLKGGAMVDVSDDEGRTPLIYAVMQKNRDLIEAIMEARPKVEAFDKYGKTAQDYCENNEDFLEIVHRPPQEMVFHLLVEAIDRASHPECSEFSGRYEGKLSVSKALENIRRYFPYLKNKKNTGSPEIDKLATRDGRAFLIKLLFDSVGDRRVEAVQTLKILGEQELETMVKGLDSDFLNLARSGDVRFVSHFVQRLTYFSKDKSLGEFAYIDAILEMKCETAFNEFLKYLDSQLYETRLHCANVLIAIANDKSSFFYKCLVRRWDEVKIKIEAERKRSEDFSIFQEESGGEKISTRVDYVCDEGIGLKFPEKPIKPN